jgi:ATP-dependent RNA helicase RhlE
LIVDNDWFQVLVFSRTKHGANRLVKQLVAKGVEASAIHGNKSQGARTKALAEFKAGKVRVLVATDIAARGIDIDQLPHVVNFDLPQVAEDYVHRIGRTGRAGATGEAVSLVSHDEFKLLVAIERLIKKEIPRKHLDGYQPLNGLPNSKGDFRDAKPKKPKSHGGNASRGRNQNSKSETEGQGRSSKKRSSNFKKQPSQAAPSRAGRNARRAKSGNKAVDCSSAKDSNANSTDKGSNRSSNKPNRSNNTVG